MPQSREDHRAYMRDRRAQEKAAKVASVVPVVDDDDVDDGPVVSAVRAELESLQAAKTMQSSAASAIALARVVDDFPRSAPQIAAAAGQLRQVMAEIRSARAPQVQSALSVIRGGRAG